MTLRSFDVESEREGNSPVGRKERAECARYSRNNEIRTLAGFRTVRALNTPIIIGSTLILFLFF